jgi:hypothetical protein
MILSLAARLTLWLQRIAEDMSKELEISIMGELQLFLGLQIK